MVSETGAWSLQYLSFMASTTDLAIQCLSCRSAGTRFVKHLSILDKIWNSEVSIPPHLAPCVKWSPEVSAKSETVA